MAFGERNTFALGVASLIAGGFYFFLVWQQSIAAGAVAAPDLRTVISYVILQVVLSVAGIVALTVFARVRDKDSAVDSEDERDRLVRIKSEAGASHLAAAGVILALGGWFIHENGYLLFHTVIAAIVLSELFRAVLQLFNYNRAY